jgi:hypothetical protein
MNAIDKELAEFVQQLEVLVKEAGELMAEALREKNAKLYNTVAESWRQAQETWLQITQGIGPTHARTIMVHFSTTGDLAKWQRQKDAGPPPSILSHYQTPPESQ